MKKFFILASFTALFVSCTNEEQAITNNTPDGAPLSEYVPIIFSTNRTTLSFTRAIVEKWDGTQRAGLFVVENSHNYNWADTTDWSFHPFTQNVPCIVNNAPILINEVSANEISDVAFVKDPITFTGGDIYYYPRTSLEEDPKNYMFFGYHPYVQSNPDSITVNGTTIEIKGDFVETIFDSETSTYKRKPKDIMACFSCADPEKGLGFNSGYIKAWPEEVPELSFQHMTSQLKCDVSKGDNNYSFAAYGLVNAFVIVPKSYTLTLGTNDTSKSVARVDLKFSWDTTANWKKEDKDTVYLLGKEIPMYDGNKGAKKGDVYINQEDSIAYMFKQDHWGRWDTAVVNAYAKYYPADFELLPADKAKEADFIKYKGDFKAEPAVIDPVLFAPTFDVFDNPEPLEIHITQYNRPCQVYKVYAPDDGYFRKNFIYSLKINLASSEQIKVRAKLNSWTEEKPLEDLRIGGNE